MIHYPGISVTKFFFITDCSDKYARQFVQCKLCHATKYKRLSLLRYRIDYRREGIYCTCLWSVFLIEKRDSNKSKFWWNLKLIRKKKKFGWNILSLITFHFLRRFVQISFRIIVLVSMYVPNRVSYTITREYNKWEASLYHWPPVWLWISLFCK